MFNFFLGKVFYLSVSINPIFIYVYVHTVYIWLTLAACRSGQRIWASSLPALPVTLLISWSSLGRVLGVDPRYVITLQNKKRCTVICQKCSWTHRGHANNLLERDVKNLSRTAPAVFPPSHHLLRRLRDLGARGYLVESKLHVTGVKIAAGFLWVRLKKWLANKGYHVRKKMLCIFEIRP